MPGMPAWLAGTVSWSAYCISTESPYTRLHRESGGGRGGGQQRIQAVFAVGVKGRVKIAADQRAHAQRAVVILLAVLGRADIHAHQDAQLGLQAKAFAARASVHVLQVIHRARGAVAVFDAIKAVQVGGRFHAADDKISRDAVARVGHGHVFDDLRAQCSAAPRPLCSTAASISSGSCCSW